MVNPDFIPMVSALFGVLVGGIVSAIISKLQHRHQKLLETYKRKIDKLEILHKLLDEVNIYYLNQLQEVTKIITHLEKNSNTNRLQQNSLEERLKHHKLPNFNQLKMLVAIYSEELVEQNGELIRECRQRFPLVEMNLLSKRNNGSENEKVLKELVETYTKINKHTESMQTHVLKSINNILTD